MVPDGGREGHGARRHGQQALGRPDAAGLLERAGQGDGEQGWTAHSSLVVREYGIPCVVACGDATTTPQDGRVVTVDGTSGIVVPAGERSDPR